MTQLFESVFICNFYQLLEDNRVFQWITYNFHQFVDDDHVFNDTQRISSE
jgi:hypothetical protein